MFCYDPEVMGLNGMGSPVLVQHCCFVFCKLSVGFEPKLSMIPMRYIFPPPT